MKSKIKKHLSIFLVGLSLLVLTDRFVGECVSTIFSNLDNGQAGSVNLALEKKSDIVILGSSRAMHHYDPKILREQTGMTAFNAGCDGQGIPYINGVSDILLRTYKPKLVIIEIRPQLFSAEFFDNQLKRITALAPYLEESSVVKEMLYDLDFFAPLKYCSKCAQFNGIPIYFLNFFRHHSALNGYEPIDKVYKPGRIIVKKYTLRYQAFAMLSDVLSRWKKAGVPVVLVTSPEWYSDTQWEMAANDFAEIVSFAEKEDVPYWQFTQSSYQEFMSADMFADSGHLNRRGAEVFTKLLGGKIKADTNLLKSLSNE